MNRRIVRESINDIKEQALITGVLCLVSELIIKGFAPKPRKVVTNKAELEVYKAKLPDGPTAVFVTTKKLSRSSLFPAVSCLSIAVLCSIILRKMK